jgi:hypothetical protein
VRYTAEPNPDIREVPAGQLWVGTVLEPSPHVVLATRQEDEEPLALVFRFEAAEAILLAQELISLANTISAPNN